MKKLPLFISCLVLFCLASVSFATPLPPQLCFTTTGLGLTIDWAPTSAATSYTLYYAPYPYTGPDSIGSLNMGSETSFSRYMWERASYFVAVTSHDASGESAYSNIELFQTTSNTSTTSITPCEISFTTANLAGTWTISGTDLGDGLPWTGSILINSVGTVTGGTLGSPGKDFYAIISGSLSISDTGLVTGHMVDDEYITTLLTMQMNDSKNQISGEGAATNIDEDSVFTFTKQ